MKKSFDQVCREVGFNKVVKPPVPFFVFYAYKGGKVEEFLFEDEAKQFSPMVERVCSNQGEIDDFLEEYSQIKNIAAETFIAELRKSVPELSDEQFQCIWGEAWENSHSYGYDEVASTFDDLYSFVKRFRKLPSLR